MAQKQCDKCGELVEEAKAFCPGCGTAFVEERTRTSVSEFDQSNQTVQLGKTMYNQMLSDMGLGQPAAKDQVEKRVEVIAPAVPTSSATSHEDKKPTTPASSKISKRTIIIIAVLALIAVAGIVVIVAAAAILYFLRA